MTVRHPARGAHAFRRSLIAFAVALALAAAIFGVRTDAQQMNAGPNVNMVKGTENDPYLQRQAEPSLDISTRNPCHILAGAVDYRTVDVPDPAAIDPPDPIQAAAHDSWLGVYKSFDCGATWTSELIDGYPQSDHKQSPLFGYTAGADPIVRAGANGMFFYGGMAFNREGKRRSAIFINRFIDNNDRDRGDTFADLGTTIIDVSEGQDFLDKPWLAVDIPRNGYGSKAASWLSNDDTRDFRGDWDDYKPKQVEMCHVNGQRFPAGRIFMSWAKFGKASPTDPTPAKLMAARSEDCGATWKIRTVSQGLRTSQGATIAISPKDGTAYIAWREFPATGGQPAIWIVRSTDGGDSWSKPLKIADINPFDQPRSDNPVRFRTNTMPTLAADDRGNVYVAWAARGFAVASGRADKTAGDSRIVMAVSPDGGRTFAKPYAVDDPKTPGHQMMPSLSYRAGKLIVGFYDFREDPVPSFKFIDGVNHRAQVWAAEATPGSRPAFRSFRVSRFRQTMQNGIPVDIEGNLSNLPLYGQGTVGFLGDYIDTAGLSSFPVQRFGVQEWVPNVGAAAAPSAVPSAAEKRLTAIGLNSPSTGGFPPLPMTFTAATDNRDVIPPRDNNWTIYYPPNSPLLEACDPAGPRTGMRNANIYTSRLTPGVLVGSLGNTKPLGTVTRGTPPVTTHLQRGFVVFLQNTTRESKFFRLTIANQPGAGFGDRASFFQLPAPPFLRQSPPPRPTLRETQIDVQVTPLSTFSRTVYVTANNRFAQVRIDLQELAASAGDPNDVNYPFDRLAMRTGGLRTSVLLNPDRTNPTIKNPEVPSAVPPSILQEEVSDPLIFAPILTTIPDPIASQEISNPFGTTTRREENPRESNPRESNPRESNPRESNPRESNAGLENTAIADITPYEIRDYSFKTTNGANKVAKYAFTPVIAPSTFPAGTQYQVLVTKRAYLPTTDPKDCSLVLQYQNQVQVNMASFNPRESNPRESTPRESTPREGTAGEQTPRESNPRESTPREGTPREGTASFLAAPGDTYTATLRVFIPKGSLMARADGAVPGPDRFRTSMPVDMVGFLPNPVLQPGSAPQVAANDDGDEEEEERAMASPRDPASLLRPARPNVERRPRPLYAGVAGVFQDVEFEPPIPTEVGAQLIAASIDSRNAEAGIREPERVSATADLVVADPPPSASVATVAPGGGFAFSWTLSNEGNADARPTPPATSYSNRFLLSRTPTLLESDLTAPIPLCSAQPPQPGRACELASASTSVTVPANGALPRATQPLTIPRTIAPGTYSVIVVADADNDVFEDSDANNASEGFAAVSITVGFNIAFASQPTNATQNFSISPAVTVAIIDGNGFPVPASEVPQVAISLGINPAGGTLAGTTVRPNINGVATFDDLQISNVGSGYRLLAAGALSAPFNVVGQLPPVANSQTVTTTEELAVSGTLTATDPEENPITYSIHRNGALGAAVVTNPATGAFTYTPQPDAYGIDSFTFLANDGTVNSAVATVTVTIAPVNDAPRFTKGADQNLTTADAQVVPNWAASISAGAANESAQQLTFTVSPSPLFAVQPAVSPTGTLTFTPNATANGTALLTVTLRDDGGSADGGVDTSAPQTFSITITTNTAPVAGDDHFATSEDTLLASAVLCAPVSYATFADAAGLTLNGQAALVGDVLRLVPATFFQHGSVFRTAPASVARFTTTFQFRMTGNGSEAGEGGFDGQGAGADGILFILQHAGATALGAVGGRLGYASSEDGAAGVAPSVAVEFDTFQNSEYGDADSNHVGININGSVFSVAAQNVPGRFDDGNVWTAWIDYDGTTLRVWASADGIRPAEPIISREIDIAAIVGPTALLGFSSATGLDFEHADILSWSYSSCEPSVLANDVDAEHDPVTARLLDGPAHGSVELNPDGTFTYVPAAEFNGVDTFRYKANDGRSDSNAATVTIALAPVNDAPSFTTGPNQTIASTAGPQSTDLWATAISAGPLDEAGQLLTFAVTSDDASLFSSPPTVSPSGTLAYTPSGAAGTATVTVVLHDNGGTANGGTDTSAPQGFTITVFAAERTADLSMTKIHAPDTGAIGRPLTYRLTVANAGPDPADSVLVTDVLPPSVTFESAVASQGTCSVEDNGAFTCNLDTLQSGAAATITVVVLPTLAEPITNVASVSSSTRDPNAANNTATDVAMIVAFGPCAQPAFSGPRPFSLNSTGTIQTDLLASGDFNGDGAPDVAVGEDGSNQVAVLFGDGLGNFGPAIHLAVGANPAGVAARDFNRDGAIDLAVALSGAAQVSILLGAGDGTFGSPIDYPVAPSPIIPVAADLDGDGDDDLVVGFFSGSSIAVLRNDGAGHFGTAFSFAAGPSPVNVIVDDFDGDGTLDVAVPNSGTANIAILRGDGAGEFAAPAFVSLPDTVRRLRYLGDVNGDGRPDLAVTTGAPGAFNLVRLLNAGGGAFAPPVEIIPGSFNVGFAAPADFNGDGKLDLAAISFATNSLLIVLGHGDGSFDAPVGFLIAPQQNQFVITDLNGDGKPDVTGTTPGAIYALLNSCGSAATADLSVTNTGPSSVANGSIVTYSITVTNDGPDGATDLTITDVLPAGTIFRASGGAVECGELNGTVRCALTALAAGDSVHIPLEVQLLAAGSRLNRAGATAGETDPNPANNSAVASTIVEAGASALVVTNTNDSGPGSLREAIDNSNLNIGSTNTITFAAGSGPVTIALATQLPNVTVPVVIDGTSQPGFAGVPIVTLDGTRTASGNGLNLTTASSTIRGLVVRGFKQAGVAVSGDGNRIGGFAADDANMIVENGGQGVLVNAGVNNSIRRNSISDNGALGIDLAPVGVTANDDGDGDVGANRLQNFPVLTQAAVSGAALRINGTLSSVPDSVYEVQFFTLGTCDASGHGEGAGFLGSAPALTDAAGNATFSVTLPYREGLAVTATAIDGAGSTSEFSNCIAALPSSVITVTTDDGTAAETATEAGQDVATFLLTRSGDTTLPLGVGVTFGGTAINGEDYARLSTTVTFPAGQATVFPVVAPINDGLVEGPETVVLTLVDGAEYDLGSPNTATITIADNATPVVTVAALDASASEVGPDPGTLRFTRAGDPSFALMVTLALTGTTTNGVDFNTLPTQVWFAPGATTADLVVTPISDAVAEGPESVIVTIVDGDQYDVGTDATATITIADVVLTITTELNEGFLFGTPGPMAATGGRGSLIFTIESGALPAGVTLETSGAFAGQALATGPFNVGVRVTDCSPLASCAAGAVQQTATRGYTLNVSAHDQSATSNSAVPGFTFGGPNGRRIGQRVTTGISGTLRGVRLLGMTCPADTTLTVDVQGVATNGGPDGSTVATGSGFGSAGAFIIFNSPPVFQSEQPFTLVIDASAVCTVQAGTFDSYRGGDGYIGLPWQPLIDYTNNAFDIPFVTMVVPATGLSYLSSPENFGSAVAVTLNDGRVLALSSRTAEIFDPATSTFSPGGRLNGERFNSSATVLEDGTVLVAGGYSGATGVSLTSAELYHPDTGTFEVLPAPMAPRLEHTATRLACPAANPECAWKGSILFAGGYYFDDTGAFPQTTLQLYDPAARSFTSIGSPSVARYRHTATMLQCPLANPTCGSDSLVLLAGGYLWNGTGATAEIVNLTTGMSMPIGPMVTHRAQHTATPMADGLVLIAGGLNATAFDSTAIPVAETFNPQTGRFVAAAATLVPRSGHSASAMSDGSVLLTGGLPQDASNLVTASKERFIPGTGFVGAGSLIVTRQGHTATTLPDGRILIVSGFSSSGITARSAELLDPGTPSMLNPTLASARVGEPYEAVIAPTGGSGQPYTLVMASPSQALPPGLVFDTFTCVADCSVALGNSVTPPARVPLTPPIQLGRISGTPTAAGTYSFDLRVTDNANRSADQTLKIRVNPLDITTPASIANLSLGVPFSTQLMATGTGPFTWSVLPAAALPPGLSLSADGTLSGTVTSTDFYFFTARVTDAFGQIATRQFFVNVRTWFDQSHFADPVSTNTLAVNGSSRVAQTVSTGVTGHLGGVMFRTLSCSVNPVVVTIQGLSATTGAPDDSRVFATATATITSPFQTIPFPTPLFFAVDAKFAIVLSSPDGSCEVTNSSVGSDLEWYPDGAAFENRGTGWTRLSDGPTRIADLQFLTVASNQALFHRSYLGHTSAVRLLDGKILFVGGNATAELYDPATHTSSTRTMTASRSYAAVTLLESGKVLVSGGLQFTSPGTPWMYHATAELYDPAVDAFVPVAAAMSIVRYSHQATRLPDGRVLLTGGQTIPADPVTTNFGPAVGTTEIFDPVTQAFTPGSAMLDSRNSHQATLLDDGRLLVTGGFGGISQPYISAEIYTPSLDSWTPISMIVGRGAHTATLLNDGRVLIAGGLVSPAPPAEIFDPATNAFAAAGSMLWPRALHTATLLADGSVLFTGGIRRASFVGTPWAAVERYVPGTGFVGAASMLVTRDEHAAALLADGRVAIGGGFGTSGQTGDTLEIYDPRANTGAPGIRNPSPPDGTRNVPYDPFLIAPIGGGGQPYTLTLVPPADTLPPGLTFDVITCAADCALTDGTPIAGPIQFGRIHGTPTASGAYVFQVRVTDRLDRSSDQSMTIRIDALDITTEGLPAAFVGEPYTATLTATGVPPVAWSIIDRSLPPGLSLSGNTISGTPVGASSFYGFTVRAIDSVGQRAVKGLGIGVQSANPLVITSTTMVDGTAPSPYFDCVRWQGGFTQPTWSVSRGSLPYGLTIRSTDGCFDGNLLETGTFTFEVAADAGAQRASRELTLRVGAIDQAQYSFDSSPTPPVVSFGGGSELAQVITSAMDGYLLGVQMPVSCSASGLRLEIRGVTGGMPDASVLAMENIAADLLEPFTFGIFHRQLRLATPLYLARGSQVAVVLSSTGTCSMVSMPSWSSGNDLRYPYGDAFIGATGAWTPLGELDPTRPDLSFHTVVDDGGRLLFEVFGRSETVPVPLTTGPNAGTVMFVAGATKTATLFNVTNASVNQLPAGRFGHESSAAVARRRHTATVLTSGRVVVLGGWDDQTQTAVGDIELYDPALNSWTTVGQLQTPRINHVAIHLPPDGSGRERVLIAGGQRAWGSPALASSEIFVYDGAGSGHTVAGPLLNDARAESAAVALSNGDTAIVGGWGASPGIERYVSDSGVGTFVRDVGLQTPRSRHAAILLACPGAVACAYGGKVLVFGGWLSNADGPALAAELYDPDTHTTTNAGVSLVERAGFAALQLASGKVLAAGGDRRDGQPLSSIELYDPSTQLFTVAAESVVVRAGVAAVKMADDSVVLVGGGGPSAASFGSAERLRPADDLFDQAVADTPYSETILFTGTAPLSFAVKSGALPPGVTLDPATGQLQGFASIGGSFRALVEITDSSTPQRRVLRAVTVQVNGGMELAFTRLPHAIRGEPYQVQLIATGGGTGRIWSLLGGVLPDDLVLAPDGLLSGTIRQHGPILFSAKAEDENGNSVQRNITLPVHTPWTTTFPEGGVVNPDAFVQSASTVYAGLDMRGLFASTDTGATWTGVTDAIEMLWPFNRMNVSLFTIGPGETFYAVTNGHPFKSTNRGASWTEITNGLPPDTPQTFPEGAVQALAVSPSDGRLLAGTFGSGVFRTFDGGANWMSSSAGLPANVQIRSIAFDRGGTDAIAYAGTAFHGVFKTSDSAATWSAAGAASNPLVEVDAIAIRSTATGTVYAVGRDSNGTAGVVRSTDGGSSWARLTPDPDVYWRPGAALAMLDSTTDTLYVASFGRLLRYTGGGPGVALGSVGDTHLTAVMRDLTSGALMVGTNGLGVFTSGDEGATWSAANRGLRGVQSTFAGAHSLAIEPSGAAIYSGSINGGYRSVDNGATWETMRHPGPSPSTVLTHWSTPGTVYSLGDRLWKSSDAGVSWQMLSTPAMCCWFDGDLAIHPFDANTLLMAVAGSPQFPDGIYRSNNGGREWTHISGGLATQQFHTLAIDPNSPSTIFAGTRGTNFPGPPAFDSGVYRSLDDGLSWTRLTNGLPPQIKPSQIVVSPWDSSTVYVSATGWPGGNGAVYKSIDGGNQWTQVLQENVFAIALAPSDPNIVYAGTWNTGGFFRSIDAGATWTQLNSGLPVQAGITAIAVDQNVPGRVLIGTSAGVYEATFASTFEYGAQPTAQASRSVSFGLQPLDVVRTVGLNIEFSSRSGALNVSAGRLVGPDASQFRFDLAECGSGLGEGRSCIAEVSFAPANEGIKSAVLEIDVTPGPSPLRVRLLGTGLSGARRIIGRVVDGFSGRPMVGARVDVFDASGLNVVASPIADADGTYFTPQLPDGSYRVRSNVPGYLNVLFSGLPCAEGCSVAAGAAITLPVTGSAVTADFTLFRRTNIAGVVAATDAPAVAGVIVRLYDHNSVQAREATTDAAGRFAFSDLNEGFYYGRTANTLGYTEMFSNTVLSTAAGAAMSFLLPPNTPAGVFVTAGPTLSDGSTPASVTFRNVLGEGKTTATASTAGGNPPLPPQFAAAHPPLVFGLQTTATHNMGVRSCFTYPALAFQNGDRARVLQLQQGAWVDVTAYVNAPGQQVCGVSETLGVFALAETADTTLTAQPCSLEPSLYSLQGVVLQSIQFTNTTTQPIQVWWLDYSGRRVLYAELPPGGSYLQGSYETHPWLITQGGQCRGIYITLPFAGQAVVRE